MSNIETFENAVRSKVKAVLFDSMPDQEIDRLVQREMKSYFEGENSAFRKLMHSEMTIHMKPKIVSAIDAFLQSQQENNTNWEKRFTESFVQEMAPFVMKGITQLMIDNALANFRNSIQRGY